MKKTLSVILVAVMLLSTLVALVVPAAAEGEGEWAVVLQAPAADAEDPAKNPPLPGYYYDANGLHTVSPDYTNFNAKFTIVSKEQFNIQNFSMTVVVEDYCIEGDNWLSFTLWSESNGFAQGSTSGKYGDGWTSLIRPDATTGALNRLESWNQTKGGRSGKQVFSNIDHTQGAPVVFEEKVNDNGGRVITFAIEDGVVKVNGVTVGAGTDQCIRDRFKEGLAYVGVTVHNTDGSGAYHPTVSVIDVNGEVPAGSDSREPEDKKREYGPMRDSSTVPEGQPAVWFDATGDATNGTKFPTPSSCSVDYAADNSSFKITAEYEAFYMQWGVPDEITYQAADFPYMLYIFKNYCSCELAEGETPATACTGSELCSIRYCAGKVTAPNNECHQAVPAVLDVTPRDADSNPLVDDLYTAVLVKIENELYVDRIHAIRLDVGGFKTYGIEGRNEFEIMGCGLFRSAGEATDFVSNFRELNLDVTSLVLNFHDCEADGHVDFDKDGYCDVCWEEMPEISDCEHVDEDADKVCDNCGAELSSGETETETETGTGAGDTTVAPDANDGTEAPTTQKADDDTSDEKGGCGSVVSMGALAIVAIVGTGLVIKKKED